MRSQVIPSLLSMNSIHQVAPSRRIFCRFAPSCLVVSSHPFFPLSTFHFPQPPPSAIHPSGKKDPIGHQQLGRNTDRAVSDKSLRLHRSNETADFKRSYISYFLLDDFFLLDDALLLAAILSVTIRFLPTLVPVATASKYRRESKQIDSLAAPALASPPP